MPKDGGQCPQHSGDPTLGRVLAAFRQPQQFPVTALVLCVVMGSHLVPLLRVSSSTPSPLSLALEEQGPMLSTAQALCPPSLAPVLLPLPPPETFWLPMQALPRQTSSWSASVLRRLGIPNLMAQEVPNQPLDYYTCPFRANKLRW